MANQIGVQSAIHEVLTGETVGQNYVAVANGGFVHEVLTGDRFGLNVAAEVLPGVTHEVLTGDGYGVNWIVGIAVAVREVLISEPPFRVSNAFRELLLQSPSEPLTVHQFVRGYRQAVVVPRSKMPLPSTVKSMLTLATYREQVVLRASRAWARSGEFASTLRMQTVMHRITVAAPLANSGITLGSFRLQVVTSRDIVYVPVSEVRVKGERQLVAQRRSFTVPSQVRTTIKVGSLVQQFIASRAQKVVVITTEVDAFTLVEQTVQATGKPAPHSPEDIEFLTSMAVQQRTVQPPNSGENVMQLVEQIVRLREPTPPHGPDNVGGLVQQTVVPRDLVTQHSMTRADKLVMLSLMHRDTYAPAYALGRHTSTLHEQIVMRLDAPMRHSFTPVKQLRLGFVLGRTTPKPWDVIDPAIGRHVKQLATLTVAHRVTIPPATISTQSRYVFNLGEQVVAGDTFPLPDYPLPVVPETDAFQVAEQAVLNDQAWGPVSAVSAYQVAGQALVGDNSGWIDPVVPRSDITAEVVAASVVVGDVFLPADVAQADAVVAGLVESLALGDSGFPNSMVPQSAVDVHSAVEFAAVGDAQFPNPMIPLSDVRSSLVGSVVAARDPSLTGNFQMSEIEVQSVLEFALIRDPTLVGIPRRTGPRPIVTVSMS